MADILGAALGGLGNIAGGIFGGLFSGKDRDAALKALDEAYKQIEMVGAPPELAKEIIYDKFNQVGLYTPELEQAIEQHYSELANLHEDPTTRNAEMDALSKLRGVSDVGITATERAALSNIRRQAAKDNAARTASIMQDFAARGQAGSGAQLAAQLVGNQTATENESEQADRVAAEANERALRAMNQYGDTASRIRGEDFNINSAKAKAADELNRFNVVANQNVQTRNINNLNNAKLQNLIEKQRVQDMNTMQTNTERLRSHNAAAQDWNNKLTYANAKASNLKAKANTYMDQADKTAETVGGIGKAAGDVAASAYNYYNAPKPVGETMSTQPYEVSRPDAELSSSELEARRRMRGF